MSDPVMFWYPTVKLIQGTFIPDGRSTEAGDTVVVDGEAGHMYHGGRLLCKEDIDKILKRCKKAKATLVKQRRADAPLCSTCQAEYKLLPGSKWQAWERGLANKC